MYYGLAAQAESHSARDGIGPILIEVQHLVVELSRGRRRPGYVVEIADIPPDLFNVLGLSSVPRSLMSGDYSAWVERLDRVQRRDSLMAGCAFDSARLDANVVVGGVAGDHQADLSCPPSNNAEGKPTSAILAADSSRCLIQAS